MSTSALARSVALRRLVCVNTLSFLAQVVQISTVPALLALRLTAAGASAVVIGAVAASSWLAILLLGRLVPRLLHRAGFLRTNALAMALTLVSMALMASTADWRVMLAANFVFGLGLILRWVSCDTWIVALAPEDIRGRAIGTHETLMGCGIAAGPLILALAGTTGTLPWLICAALLLCASALLPALAGASGAPQVPDAHGMRGVVRKVPAAVAAGFLAGFVETAAISFLPILGAGGIYILSATTVLAMFGAGGTLLQVPLGWLADTLGYRRAQALVVATVIACGAALLAVDQRAWALAGVLFIFGGMVGGMNTLAVIEAGQRVAAQSTSTAMLAIAMAYTVGGVSGPLATGLALRFSAETGFSVIVCGGALLFVPLWMRAARRDQHNAAEESLAAQPRSV